ncbi:MAG: RusA family crossover junction endodeoxyribonuclease [Oscillibacter sp.]|nr:RusA family crossover junction endodeoxyribonuclease [Oscillibacter sp.]
MERIQFFLPMAKVPTVTHQEQGVRVVNGKPVFYDTPEIKAARAKLLAHLAPHSPEKPMQGAVRLLVKWCFPCGEDHQDGEYRITRPDTDNLQKLLKDCMTKCGFWKDDAQVASEICEKFWSRIPGLFICTEEIGGSGQSFSDGIQSFFETTTDCQPQEVTSGRRNVNPCSSCDCWNGDAEGCTMPTEDKVFACPLEIAEKPNGLCATCRWYAEFEGICTNGKNKYRADFREPEDTCPEWES